MINYDETIIEHIQFDNSINDSETILDPACDYSKMTTGENEAGDTGEGFDRSSANALLPDICEGAVVGNYRIMHKLSQGAQARVFMAECDEGTYVVKAYGRGWQPAKALRTFFRDNSHDNIMPIVDSGRELGMYYEVYPFYEEGTLEDYIERNGTLSVDYIKKYVVPSVNEGLHYLHVNNIVHCDIKPANLYLDRRGDDIRIVIGDLGSCRVMDSDGMVRSTLEGTVNYSVPVEEFYGVKTFPKEYDYASLGITLYRLYTGSHLMEGLSLDERARMWNRSLAVPVDDVRLKNLLSGLINKDFKSVWGYEELKRWGDSGWNSGKKRRPIGRKGRESVPLVFGTVNGELLKVTTIHELVEACKSNWNLAATVIKRYDTLQFIRQWDVPLYEKVEAELQSKIGNDNIVLFRILYRMEKTNRICYKGEDLGTLNDYLQRLNRGDETAVEFAVFDLLTYYMEIMDADPDDVDRLDELVKLNRLNALGLRGMIDGICRAFMNNVKLELGDCDIDSMNAFVDYIACKTPTEINEILKREDVQAWFTAMGFNREIEVIKMLQEV